MRRFACWGGVTAFLASFVFLAAPLADAASSPLFRLPGGVALDGAQHLYVANQRNHTIQKLSTSGRLLTSWNVPSSGGTSLFWPTGVGVDGSGNVYALVPASASSGSVLKMSPRGKLLARWSRGFPKSPAQAMSLVVDSHGDSYTLFRLPTPSSAPAGSYKAEIVRLSPQGKPTQTLITTVSGFAGVYPTAITLDRAGNIYLLMLAVNDCPSLHEDCRRHYTMVEKLSAGGRVLARWHTQYRGALYAESIAVDPRGNLYLGAVGRVIKISSRFQRLATWRVNGCGASGLGPVFGMALDARGNIYASTSHGNDRYGTVQELSPAGKVLRVWGSCA